MRNERDDYPTPPWCYELLEPLINWNKVESFWEPCCGDSRIIRWAEEQWLNPNIWTGGFDIKYGVDYLITPVSKKDLIITNPPYSLSMAFVAKGLQESVCSFWLLRLAFLASQQRRQFFLNNPLTALIILSKRPSFRLTGGTDNSDYGWFVWDKGDTCKVKGIIHL